MKKRVLALLLSITMVLGMVSTAWAAEATDTVDVPVEATETNAVTEIATVDDLLAFAAEVNAGDNYAGKTVKLTANLDLAGMDWLMIGSYGKPFSGEFDGNGKTISNLTDSTAADHKGLFAHLNNAYVHDLTLADVNFSGTCEGSLYAGALVGEAESKNVIENVDVDGITWDITSKNGSIGSIAGYTYDTYYLGCEVKNAVFTVTSTGSVNMGGMVGQGRGVREFNTEYGTTSNFTYSGCVVDGVTFNVTGKTTVGGFLGCDGYNHWSNSGAYCEVKDLVVDCAADDAQYAVGGFMGNNFGTGGIDPAFTNCITTGVVNAEDNTNTASVFGGFFGVVRGRDTTVAESSAKVDIHVSAGDVGGFVGSVDQYQATDKEHVYSFSGCTASGNVATDNGVAGGFAGELNGGTTDDLAVNITDCTVAGTVNGTTAAAVIGNINDGDHAEGGVVNVSGTTVGENVTVNEEPVTEDNLYGGDTALIPDPNVPEGAEVVTIGSAADFDAFAAAVNGQTTYQGYNASWNEKLYVKITADIDMSQVTFTTAIGSYGNGGGFSGTLDGQGHTLSNYTVSGNWNYGRALFRQASNITVKDITFDNFTSDAAGATDIKTRPAGIIFASVLGTKNVFENVTLTNSVLYGDNGLGTLMGYGSGDYSNTYVTEYTFNKCTVKDCTIYSETERAAILGEFGRDGDVILTITDCVFSNNKLIATIDGETTTSDLDVWYNHGGAAIEMNGKLYTYEHVETAIDAAVANGGTIVLAKDLTLTEEQTVAVANSGVKFDLNGYALTVADGYKTETVDGVTTVKDANAAYIGEQGYESLEAAIAAAVDGDTIILAAGTHTMPGSVVNKNITITAAEGADVVVEMLTAVNASGSTVAFEGITAKFDNDNYEGLQHSVKVTYTGCTIEGCQFLYAPEVSFTGCTFNVEGDAYAVWTYGAKDVTFADCTFNTDGKAILVYTESAHTAAINVSGCEFNAATNRGKAAVEIGASWKDGVVDATISTYTLNITGSTADENFVANNTESNLWGNKDSITTESGSAVVIDNSENLMPAPVGNSAYVSNNNGVVTIWGEAVNADPENELYMNILAADGTVMGKVVLNDVDGIYAATTSSLTWHAMVIGDEYDTYWSTTWNEGYPSADVAPANVALYIDGKLVNTASVHMSGADDLNPVVWAELFKTYAAQIGEKKYESISAAFSAVNAGETVKLLADGVLTGNLKIYANKGAFTLDLNGNDLDVGANQIMVYNELTVKGSGKVTGSADMIFQVVGKLTIEGDAEYANPYGVIYPNPGSTVAINGGTYPQGGISRYDVLDIDNIDVTKAESVTIATPNGYGWVNNKLALIAVAQLKGRTELYATLQDAIDAVVIPGQTVILLDDVAETGITVAADKDIVIDLNGKTVTGDFMVYGKATIKNGTIVNNAFVSGIETNGASADLTVEDLTITSTRHALRLEGGKATIISGTYSALGRVGQTETVHAVNAGGNADTIVIIKDGTFNGIRIGGLNENPDSGAAVNAQAKATVTIEGGTFLGGQNETLAAKNGGTISVTGGKFDQDPTAYCADGYWAFQKYNTKNLFFVEQKKDAPVAIVEELGTLTITAQNFTNNMVEEELTLESAYNFIAPDKTAEEALASQYSTWLADFVVSVDKDIPANSIVLAGNYGDYGWISFTNPEAITAGTEIRLLGLFGYKMNYYELCTLVQEFKCGVADINNVLDGVNFTVELQMFPVMPYTESNTTWNNEVEGAEPIVSNAVTYEIGSTEDKEQEDANLTIVQKSLNMASYIGAQYAVNTSAASAYDSVYLVVTHNDKETTVTENIGEAYSIFAYEYALAAKELSDELTVSVYGVKNGVSYKGETITWSAKSAAISALDSTYNTESSTEGQKKMAVALVNLLKYGEEAQKVFNYNLENLATAGIVQKHADLITTTVPAITDTSSVSDNGINTVTLIQKSLALQSVVEIQLGFKNVNLDNHVAKVAFKGETYEVALTDIGVAGYGAVVFNELTARAFRESAEITICDVSGQPVSETYTMSIENLAAIMKNSDAGKAELANAMMNYSDAVKAALGG